MIIGYLDKFWVEGFGFRVEGLGSRERDSAKQTGV